MWQNFIAQIMLEQHLKEENIGSEEYEIISPIHLSETKVLFEGKKKPLIKIVA